MFELEIKKHNGAITLKTFDTEAQALHFLSAKGYVYDEIEEYYWAVNPSYGWLTTARIKKKRKIMYKVV